MNYFNINLFLTALYANVCSHGIANCCMFQAESNEAKDLKMLLVTLGFPKPPANITPQQLFNKAHQKVSNYSFKLIPLSCLLYFWGFILYNNRCKPQTLES